MSPLKKRLTSLQDRLTSAWGILRLDDRASDIKTLEDKTVAPDFWSDQNNAKKITQELAGLKSELEKWQSAKSKIQELLDLEELASEEGNEDVIKEVEVSIGNQEETMKALELELLLSEPNDARPALVTIHAGAGGTDAQDWAEILLRMLLRFCEKKDWQTTIIEQSQGEEAGIKRVMFQVTGRYAYGYLKSEAGVHRLVRISPFDAEKMRHTSFALVEVIPELDELSEQNIAINESDLRIDTFMSSGPGGQGVNTTHSAVRITHEPTKTVVTCQNERSQQQNKETAMRVLKSRLFQKMQEERAEKLEELKGGHKAPEWGNQIRSYVLHPYKMVKDHRTGEETPQTDNVLSGDLDAFIESYLRKSAEENREV